MTKEEMIAWAGFPGTPDADFNVVGYYEAQKRLIFIAQTYARTEVWKQVEAIARQQADASAISSYPGGFNPPLKTRT